ncbi:unnamed protein product [Effrenium voratum]|uniref:Histidine kinase/HSP90-like ATPase domain-containing protein n=1 Tax=Effrenium voratum TaxID=2562239 RepID=A0AA36NGB0_9DINO|nr:unnamed protein product [Effrenium voratum]
MAPAELETYAFNADISQLMSLIINAFYTNKEIFLRELISNASDALDKIAFQGSQDPSKLEAEPNLCIKVTPDRDAGTVTVEDTGIGMTREEMILHLGTIAKSGTKAFMEAVSAGADMSMIGQFGVGFYSSYLVSEKVRVVSKSNDDEQHIWESTAGGTFLVWKDTTFEHGVISRGTKVICYLKDDQAEFLESDRLKELIMKHSAFVGYPIDLRMEHRKEEEVEVHEEGEEAPEKRRKVTVSYSWELINKNKPLWLRPAEGVAHEEYAELYKFLSGDWEDHLAVKHVAQGGQVDFKALLYCPKNAPKDMFDMGKMSQRFSIRLYVRRVFIKEFNDLIPKWMGFIKGIVDSDDMPLNISREMLQQNAILKHIKTGLQKNIFSMFQELSQDKERFKAFQEAFSQCLKLGVYEDHANREQIIPLLRYHSSKSGEDLVGLDEYIERMKPGQRHILYITGRTKRDAARSPYIEGLKRDGFEVLYMTDPVDEYAAQFLKEYRGYEVLSCMSMDAARLLDHRSEQDLKAELEPLRKKVQALSPGFTVALASLPVECCARLAQSAEGKVLELNFKHSLLKELGRHSAFQASAGDDALALDLSRLLQDLAELEAAEPDDPKWADACERCQELLQALNADVETSEEVPALGKAAEEEAVTERAEISPAKASDIVLSCGRCVRIVRPDRARRAMITFVDEDAQTVDVLYPKPKGCEKQEDEEEGVAVKLVQALQDFEQSGPILSEDSLYKAASAAKEQGNQLFKLKDFEAAAEFYSAGIAGFAQRPIAQGEQVLMKNQDTEKVKGGLTRSTVLSMDAEGSCEMMNGQEAPASELLPVCQELLPLHTSLYMNRARCRQNLGQHKEAAQDLTAVLGLWEAADKRLLQADPEMKEAQEKGLYTAEYLRARSRLARGLSKAAAQDVKEALVRSPPAATVKQLKQLKVEVTAAQEKQRQVNGPLAKELAKLVISLRGGPQIS